MKIKPIKDLRNTNEISNECHEYDEPIFITKNGYEDLVLMSNEYFDKILPASVKTKDVGQYINTYCKKDCVNNSFLKVALANPTLKVCDVDYNKEIIKNKIFEAANHGASLIIFPELSLTSYTCRDIFFQKSLINRVESSLKEIVEFTANKSILVLLTTPLFIDNNLIDAVVAIENGTILSIVPKKHYKGIDERAFSNYVKPTKQIELYNDKPLIGNDIILVSNYDKRIKIGIILGDDINDICSSYCNLIKGGANIIINPAADKMIVEDIENKKSFIKGLSSSSSIAIITQSAGKGESTTDYVLSGLNLICECGQTLLDKDIISSKEIEYTDIDIELVSNKCAEKDFSNEINYIGFDTKPEFNELDRKYSAFPFLFDKEAKERYMSIIKTQVFGYMKRLNA